MVAGRVRARVFRLVSESPTHIYRYLPFHLIHGPNQVPSKYLPSPTRPVYIFFAFIILGR